MLARVSRVSSTSFPMRSYRTHCQAGAVSGVCWSVFVLRKPSPFSSCSLEVKWSACSPYSFRITTCATSSFSIQLPNGILNQLLRIKGYCIDGFVIDSVPERKKFLLFQLLRIKCASTLPPLASSGSILRPSKIEESTHDRRCTVLHLRGHLHRSVLLVRVIRVGQFSATDIAVLNQILINGVRQFFFVTRTGSPFAFCRSFPRNNCGSTLRGRSAKTSDSPACNAFTYSPNENL